MHDQRGKPQRHGLAAKSKPIPEYAQILEDVIYGADSFRWYSPSKSRGCKERRIKIFIGIRTQWN